MMDAAHSADWTIPQGWEAYTAEEHATWVTLYDRQAAILPGRACDAYLRGLKALDLRGQGIPDFRRLSETLFRLTGWQVVAVPGLVPEDVFFDHLANRRFPAGNFIRTPQNLDYLQEPDVFHDVFGHVPMLTDPVFADFMQAYGNAGTKAEAEGGLKMLARLYWYCVEFGLIRSGGQLRAYGAGILSSAGETVYSLQDPRPHRIGFDLERVIRTDYLIDAYQQTYFVVDSFEQLFRNSYERDFAPLYRAYRDLPGIPPATLLPTDDVVTRGTQGAAGDVGH